MFYLLEKCQPSSAKQGYYQLMFVCVRARARTCIWASRTQVWVSSTRVAVGLKGQ